MTPATEMICVRMPIKIVSILNTREHHMARHRRAKAHRSLAYTLLRGTLRKPPAGEPVEILLTRIAQRELDGHDNLTAGFKAAADGVADWLGIDDSNPLLTWRYVQRRGPPKQYEAEIVVKWALQAGT